MSNEPMSKSDWIKTIGIIVTLIALFFIQFI